MSERLTWEEIKEKYPDQYVGLKDIIINEYTMSAIVYCTSEDTEIDDMHLMAYRGEIQLEYTTLDEYMDMGAISLRKE